MTYEVEGQEKRMKVHYFYLKLWADPPPYLTNYFKTQNCYQELQRLKNEEIIEENHEAAVNETHRGMKS